MRFELRCLAGLRLCSLVHLGLGFRLVLACFDRLMMIVLVVVVVVVFFVVVRD